MKLKCDLCGGDVVLLGNQGICRHCGIQYGPDRIREKAAETRVEKIVLKPEPVDLREIEHNKKDGSCSIPEREEKQMRTMWRIFALICAATFFGVFFADSPAQEAYVGIGCMAAAVLDFVIFKPWKVYGGKSL